MFVSPILKNLKIGTGTKEYVFVFSCSNVSLINCGLGQCCSNLFWHADVQALVCVLTIWDYFGWLHRLLAIRSSSYGNVLLNKFSLQSYIFNFFSSNLRLFRILKPLYSVKDFSQSYFRKSFSVLWLPFWPVGWFIEFVLRLGKVIDRSLINPCQTFSIV